MPVIGIVHAAEIRVLGPSCMEDYHAHLLRLDGSSCLPGDHRGIDAHCLDLIASGAILVGAYVQGVMRAAAEIVPDRTARRAEAAVTVENSYQQRGYERDLIAKIIDEARRYHLNEVRVQDQNSSTIYRIPVLQLHSYAANG